MPTYNDDNWKKIPPRVGEWTLRYESSPRRHRTKREIAARRAMFARMVTRRVLIEEYRVPKRIARKLPAPDHIEYGSGMQYWWNRSNPAVAPLIEAAFAVERMHEVTEWDS
jgi:hypothetical protein